MFQVLHLYSHRNWTGPAELVVNLCAVLRSRFSTVLIHETSKKKPVSIAPMAEKYGVVTATPLRLRRHHGLIQVGVDVARLISYLKRQGVRLVHAHLLGDHIVGGLAARATGTPLLRTLHFENSRLGLRERILLTRFTDGLIVPTNRARENILNQLGSLQARIWVVAPGVDTARFDPKKVSGESVRKKFGIGPEEYVLGIVSRIRSERKVGVAVEAFAKAQKTLPYLRLLIVGQGKKRNIEKNILEPVSRYRIEDRVTHVSHLGGVDYVEALAAMDAGIYLAPGSDRTCRTVLELMAMGKPLIAGNPGILSGLVEHGGNGFAVDAEPEKTAAAIIDLARDRLLSERMGQRSLQRVRERFCLTQQADAVAEIYQAFLRRSEVTIGRSSSVAEESEC